VKSEEGTKHLLSDEPIIGGNGDGVREERVKCKER
jgi:hypothetical protein